MSEEHISARLRGAWALYQSGRLSEAENISREILAQEPECASALHLWGMVFRQRGRSDQAVQPLMQAARIEPDSAELRNSLAAVLADCGHYDEAIHHLRRAIALRQGYADAHNNLGVALAATGEMRAAETAYCEAVRLRSDYVEAMTNLADLLRHRGQLVEALRLCRHALEIRPDYAPACDSISATLEELGRTEEATEWNRRLLALRPCDPRVRSNYLLGLHYAEQLSAVATFAEHVVWARRHADPVMPRCIRFANAPDPDRILRVGYLSPDFREHAVAQFITPILAGHDRHRVATICYSNVAQPDARTLQLRSLAGQWRDISSLSDDAATQLIREDQIDVLVELSGHMARNRLLVLARRPAPVQVTYLGYPDTTGLTSIDYRITDAVADPPGETDALHTERLLRLDRCAWCYQAPPDAPVPGPLEARARGHVTFGMPNRLVKVSPSAVALWARILNEVPESRLLVLGADDAAQELRERLERLGVEPRRTVHRTRGARQSYWAALAAMDLALDPFPYNGTTTTCDLLWMGVPVITLAGSRHAGRVGASLLRTIGLPELIALSDDDYVRIATSLATDWSKLEHLRSTLRSRLCTSPLTDAQELTSHLEHAYRWMWRQWCAQTAR